MALAWLFNTSFTVTTSDDLGGGGGGILLNIESSVTDDLRQGTEQKKLK